MNNYQSSTSFYSCTSEYEAIYNPSWNKNSSMTPSTRDLLADAEIDVCVQEHMTLQKIISTPPTTTCNDGITIMMSWIEMSQIQHSTIIPKTSDTAWDISLPKLKRYERYYDIMEDNDCFY